MEIIVLLGVVIIVITAIVTYSNAAERMNDLKAAEASIKERHPRAETVRADEIVVGFDFDALTVIFSTTTAEFGYPFSKIASVEVVEDGSTLTKTNRGSQLMGAAVGGLALGGVGAIVGGLSGSSTSSAKIQHLSVRVIVDDPKMPVHEVKFIDCLGSSSLKRNGFLAKLSLEAAARCNALFINAIRKANESRQNAVASPSATVAVHIEKLWTLHTAGAITRSEYESEKAKLLQPKEA